MDDLSGAIRDPRRLAAVRGTHLLEAPAAPNVERIVALAARLLRAPTALLTLVDGDRDVIKAHVGVPDEVAAAGEVRAFPSFCQVGIARHHAMLGHAARAEATPGAGPLLIVGDATNDSVFGEAFAHIPSVAQGVRACITAPLLDGDGQGVGSLCVIDFATRQWTSDEVATLADLANAAAGEIALHTTIAELATVNAHLHAQTTELELQTEQLEEQRAELEAINLQLQTTAALLEREAAVAEGARADAEAANASKALFLTTMSHELRTPLNAIGGYAELMEMGIRGPTTEQQQHDLSRIRASQRHLLSLINDILNFAKLEAGQVEVRLNAVDVATAITDAEALVAPQVRARGLSLVVGAPATPVAVRADAEKLRQILLNLLTNALKFTDSGGTIAVGGDTTDDVVHLWVSDTGRGIPADEVERVFEAFVQIDRHLTQHAQQGVGLGLAISRELARAMGGDLSVTSRVGVGSRFTLTLAPRALPSFAPNAQSPTAERQ